jgi:hypothetical protein
MTDGVDKDNIVEEVAEMTEEEKAAAWEKWVRGELNSALDIFLPIAKAGDVYTSYRAHKIEELETGPVYSTSKAAGVSITVVFDFEKPIDLTKARDEQE